MLNFPKWFIEWRLEGMRKRAWERFAVVKKYEERLEEFKKAEENLADEMFEKMKNKLVAEGKMETRIFNDYPLWRSNLAKKLRDQIGKCEKCGRNDFQLTIDHIIPQMMLRDFGRIPELERDERNMRLLCKPCNVLKAHHLDFTDKRTKPLLLEYVGQMPGSGLFPTTEIRGEESQPLPSTFAIPRWLQDRMRRNFKRLEK